MVFIDFCCLLQTLTNASAIITGVIQTLLVRIPWAHTFALAKLDSMEMEKSALVTITTLFFYVFPTFICNLFTSFSGLRPAQRECARTGLRSHASCHLYPIPHPVKVGHTTRVYDPYSFRIVMWVLVRPTFWMPVELTYLTFKVLYSYPICTFAWKRTYQ